MIKILRFFLVFLFFFFLPTAVYAQNSFVSVVNPIRGNDFWDLKGQSIDIAVNGELEILKKYNVLATWLIRYDALLEKNVVDQLKNTLDEKGLFLEVTPTWTREALVSYHQSKSWHLAGSAFLTGYELKERERLIDKAFEKFKAIFGEFPKTVGAWWIDAYSLSYMQQKYSITSALIVADQYSTDNYQIWGQYFSTPYYPSKTNALYPAQSLDEKIHLVMVQWAPRDPVNAYGNGVGESTYSVQANDYIDYHNLDINYFLKLVNLYTNQPLNKFGQIIVGLENSYDWKKYSKEYENQIRALVKEKEQGRISLVTLSNFSSWYQNNFPNLSPEQIIIASDPLGSYKKAVWFMNPYFRAGWFVNQDGSVFRDIRQYLSGSEELCFRKRCESVNFATSATRALDEVSFGHKWILDSGRINGFKVGKEGLNYVITYKNEAGKNRTVEFLPRDISIDGKIFSIDTAILDATKKDIEKKQISSLQLGLPEISIISILFNVVKFILFLIFACIIPGIILTKDFAKINLQRLFLSTVTGIVFLTLVFYILSILKIKPLTYIYIILNLAIFIRLKLFNLTFVIKKIQRIDWLIAGIILAGTIFQVIPTFKSGLEFSYGIGLWGPNTHDGVWHISLINQLIKSVPPQNPIFAGEILKNYHYFYDLLIAVANYLSSISVSDLLFRFFPIIFSLCLGVGTYFLIQNLFSSRVTSFRTKIATLFSLYFVYFSGSFGWIVEFVKQRHLGGESAFWANQSISFNLNPPFALSLIIIIALLQTLPFVQKLTKKTFLVNVILIGCLVSFKSYAGSLMLATIFIFGSIYLIKRKDLSFMGLFIFSGAISAILFLSNFKVSTSFLVIAPFWFVNSMIDAPDRVGWERLSLMRMVGESQKMWFKFIAAEGISFIIFILGNLGLRFLNLAALIKFKKIIQNNTFLFITIFSLLSVLIPTIFIQAGNPWNTIQFIYYYLYIAAVISGIIISWIIFKPPKFVSFILVTIILILTPINSVVTALGYLPENPHAYISQEELQGLNFLSTQPEGIVLVYPYNEKLKNEISEPWPIIAYDSTAYVSAFSKKDTYLEDLGQNQILLTDYKKRLVASNDFFLGSSQQQVKFLDDNHIRYIYLPKIFNKKIDEENGVKNIFENGKVVIYSYK